MDTLPFVKTMREVDTLAKSGDMEAAAAILDGLQKDDLTEKQQGLVEAKRTLLTRQAGRSGVNLAAPSVSRPAVPAAPALVAQSTPAPVLPSVPTPAAIPVPEPTREVEVDVVNEPTPAAESEPTPKAADVSATDSDLPDELKLPPEIELEAAALSARLAASRAAAVDPDETTRREPVAPEDIKPSIKDGAVSVAGDSIRVPEGADAFSTVSLHGQIDAEDAPPIRTEAATSSGGAGVSAASSDPMLELAAARVEARTGDKSPGSPGYVDENQRQFQRTLMIRTAVLVLMAVAIVLGAVWLWSALSSKPIEVNLTGTQIFKDVAVGSNHSKALKSVSSLVGDSPNEHGQFDNADLSVYASETDVTVVGQIILNAGLGKDAKEWMLKVDTGAPISSKATLREFESRLKAPWVKSTVGDPSEVTWVREGNGVIRTLKFQPIGESKLPKLAYIEIKPAP